MGAQPSINVPDPPAWVSGNPIEEGPEANAAASLILLHGFASMMPLNGMQVAMEGLRVIFPSAPLVDMFGFPIPSWLDATDPSTMMDPTAMMQQADDMMAQQAVQYIHELIRREVIRGVPAERIVVGGFSQGGLVAIRAALSFPDASLGGALAMSTFFGADGASVAAANERLRVLVAHGNADGMVPPAEGRRVETCIRRVAPLADVQCKLYDAMGHATCPEE